MSDHPPGRTQAETRRSWWPGWIWAIPIAAVAVAGWLGVRAIAEGGKTVTVSFDAAHGMKKGDTKVQLRGVDVGEVSHVSLADNARGVEIKLKLDRSVDKYLRTGTRFWLEGATFSLTDLSSVKALVAGPTIVMEPGTGAPARRFVGLDQPPAIPTPTPGTAFVLTADRLGSLQQGSPIYYAGEQVGKITQARLVGPHSFRFGAFVRSPYDKLVTAGTRFWDASGVEVSAEGGGVKAHLVSPEALLTGAVAFDTPPQAGRSAPAVAGEAFPLYPDKRGADAAPVGPQVPYLIRFGGAVGGLEPGARVNLRGFQVGEVTRVELAYDARSGALETPVEIALEPDRLNIQGVAPPASGDWRPIVDAMLRRLVSRGLRASLTQTPPVIGGKTVTLDFSTGARPAALTVQDGMVVIPSTASGDIASITAKADQIMSKVNAVPIEQIGDNVRQITARIRRLVSSPKLDDIIDHVDDTSAEVDRTVRQAAPEVTPLIKELRRTADEADSTVTAANRVIGGDPESQDSDLPSALHELTETARSIRALADYLDRHPEALLRGKAKPKDGR